VESSPLLVQERYLLSHEIAPFNGFVITQFYISKAVSMNSSVVNVQSGSSATELLQIVLSDFY
jgi:hypothetical protein